MIGPPLRVGKSEGRKLCAWMPQPPRMLGLAMEVAMLVRLRRAADARLLWDMGQAVDAYVTRVFEARVLCPFSERPKDEASDRSP